LAPGIDLKGEGGYIVVAPSIHPSGNPYRWDGEEGHKVLLHPANVPAWLLERIGTARNSGARKEPAAENAAKWAPGERNNRLASLAGTMRRRDMARETIEAALLAENRRRCEPPLPDVEVRRIAASVAAYRPSTEAGGAECDREDTNTRTNWPDELRPEAFHGVAGVAACLSESRRALTASGRLRLSRFSRWGEVIPSTSTSIASTS
jgi:hypothetical protein